MLSIILHHRMLFSYIHVLWFDKKQKKRLSVSHLLSISFSQKSSIPPLFRKMRGYRPRLGRLMKHRSSASVAAFVEGNDSEANEQAQTFSEYQFNEILLRFVDSTKDRQSPWISVCSWWGRDREFARSFASFFAQPARTGERTRVRLISECRKRTCLSSSSDAGSGCG